MENVSRLRLLEELREKIQRLEGPQSPREPVCSTGFSELDRLLPQGGLACDALTEWVSAEGSGAATLALLLVVHLQKRNGPVVVIDDRREFYPPAAQMLGLALEQTLVVQTCREKDTLWAWEQALRSAAVAAVLGRVDRLNDRTFRRLQLAAEAGAAAGFLLRPTSCLAEASWAEARFLVEALPGECRSSSLARRLRVEVLYCRGGSAGRSIELELCDETDPVRLVPVVRALRAGRG